MATKQNGFETEFVEKPPKVIQSECSVCLQVLRKPYQVTCCGYSFCRVCIESIKDGNNCCPCCKIEKFDFYPNKGLQRFLYEFEVYCTNKSQGCQWIGELGQLESHLNCSGVNTSDDQQKSCEYSEVLCQ